MRNILFSKFLVLAVLALSLSSCQPVGKLLYGIKKPKQKEKSKILKYADKHNFSDRENYALVFNGYVDRSARNGGTVNTIKFFDYRGNLLIPKTSLKSTCSARISGYISELGDTSLFIATDSLLFTDYVDGLTTLDGDNVEVSLEPNVEFYAVVTWATFAGRLNRNLIEWESLLDSMSAHHQISVTRLNLDMQSFWGNDPQYTGELKPEDFE